MQEAQTFVAYAQSKGLDLTKDDIKFMRQCLGEVSWSERRGIVEKYVSEWLLGMESVKIQHMRQNAGRRRGNLWLLNRMG